MKQIIFDEFYKDYDSWYLTQTGCFVDKVETAAALTLLTPKNDMRLLDIGCGTGNFSLKLARQGCRVTGIDIAQNMLAQAQAKAASAGLPIEFYKMDCARMGFADNSFDTVLSMAAFEFVADARQAYNEMKRVVKPGGIIVIGTIQQGGAWANLYQSDACAATAYAHACFKTKADLTALDPKNVEGTAECLFLPPGLAETAYTLPAERESRNNGTTGGFVCVKYRVNK